MDNNELYNSIDEAEFSLESILAEYEAHERIRKPEAPRDRAREIVMEALSDSITSGRVISGDPGFGADIRSSRENAESHVAQAELELAGKQPPNNVPETVAEYDDDAKYEPDGEYNAKEEYDDDIEYDGYDERPDSYMQSEAVVDEQHFPPEEYSGSGARMMSGVLRDDYGYYASTGYRDSVPSDYAYSDELRYSEEIGGSGRARGERRQDERRSFLGVLLSPIVGIFAIASVKKREQQAGFEADEDELYEDEEEYIDEEPEIPEMAPVKAAKHYAGQRNSLLMRTRLAFLFSVFLIIIACFQAWGWKLPGALNGVRVASIVSVILLFAIMLAGLDIFSAGIASALRGSPGAETLVALSCVFSVLDAIAVFSGKGAHALPYCAVSGVSMVCALWGARLTCSGLATGLRMAVQTTSSGVVTAEPLPNGGFAMLRTEGADFTGFVRRSEEPDVCEDIYRLLTPFLLASAVVLAGLSIVVTKAPALHTLSGFIAVSSAFSTMLAFPLPYSLASAKLRNVGAALAGGSGCADISESHRIIITDDDLFPNGTVKVSSVNIAEDMDPNKVVSYTAGLLSAAGMQLATPFVNRTAAVGLSMPVLEEFEICEGGGQSALIRGERVLIGSSGFMNLMGVRMSGTLEKRNAVYTAIDGRLAGAFVFTYEPKRSVSEALLSLLRGSCDPIFAVRDFNITPQFLRRRFKLPMDKFDFPSYEERFDIAATLHNSSVPISAVLSRPGLSPFFEAADRGRRVYRSARVAAAISAACSFIGMALMFILLKGGDIANVSAGSMLLYMLVWLAGSLSVCFVTNR